jgi:hypothetical protein
MKQLAFYIKFPEISRKRGQDKQANRNDIIKEKRNPVHRPIENPCKRLKDEQEPDTDDYAAKQSIVDQMAFGHSSAGEV